MNLKRILILLIFTINCQKEKELRVVFFSSDPPAIVPYKAFDPDSYAVINHVFDKLVIFDSEGNIIPWLAESWKRIDPFTIEFKLRQGIKFHHGDELTSDDVQFTFETHLNPDIKSPTNGILATIKEVQIIDKYTFRIISYFPDGLLLFRLTMFSDILPSNLIKKIGYEEFAKNPIGTGPFQFSSWEREKRIILKKNENYWQKGWPKYETLIFEMIPQKDWSSALLQGKVDIVYNLQGIDVLKFEMLPELKILRRPAHIAYQVILSNQGPLKDIEIRKALNYAINRNRLIIKGDYGFGIINPSLGKVDEFGSAFDQLQPYPYDPRKAKMILQSKGFTRENPLILSALVADVSYDVFKEIKTQLEDVGIQIKEEVVSRSEWALRIPIAKMTKGKADFNGDMAISMVNNPIKNAGFHYFIFLHSKGPFSILNDSDYDKKLEWAITTTDDREHESRLKEVDKMIYQNAYMIFTYQKEMIVGLKNNIILKSIMFNGHVYNSLWNVEIED